MPKNEELLDQEWIDVLIEMIDSGISKEEFRLFLEQEKQKIKK